MADFAEKPKEGARTRSKKALSRIVISARRLALALLIKFIFKFVPFFEFANGGSISIVRTPLVLTALYCGPLWGVSIGLAYGVFDRLIDGARAYHWRSLILDYFVGFGVRGIAAIFRRAFYQKKTWSLVAGRSLAGFCRFVSSFFSGLLISWDNNPNGALDPALNKGGFIYSLGYNLGYRIPSVLICILLLLAISKPLFETQKLPIVLPLVPKDLKEASSEGKSVPLSLETTFTFISIVSLVLVIFSLVPPCGESLKGWNFWAGYFWLSGISLVVAFARLVYAVYQLIYGTKNDTEYVGYFKTKRTFKKFYWYRIIVSLVLIALSRVSIIGRYTFYSPLYSAGE